MRQYYVLQTNPSKDDTSWVYTAPLNELQSPKTPNVISGKCIHFGADRITLKIEKFPSNRILQTDDPTQFIMLAFGSLRFPETTLRATSDYIKRLLKAGLFLNDRQYRFYHHSNSQLRGRSCFLRRADTDVELDARINKLGDFARIMNAAKRAKRIGLLFSEAHIDWRLDPVYTKDIPDIRVGEEVFSDGCGLISKRLAVQLSKSKKIIFRGMRYTPTVYQIRYLGYKGVVMLHPPLDSLDSDGSRRALVEFRQSMKKFSTTTNHTFSVVDFSKPYMFGRLNSDILVLLSSLGISNEKLLAKQQSYFQLITQATVDPSIAFNLLSAADQYPLAEKVLLDGLGDPSVSAAIRKVQRAEIASFKNDRDKPRSRMLIAKSRLLFGVCDPFGVLKEGQVHIRITVARKGPSTPIHGDVLVVRNPCLYPGDCLKLRAVSDPKLDHLVDCIVFSGVAKPGRHAAPSMSSGGDLDGDKFFVCWDPDLVPPKVAEPYDYPPNKEKANRNITREDLANHFSAYSGAGVARIASLHSKWVRASPLGALCTECQELNALHSQCVDGASVKIPDRLTTPPESETPYILDLLHEAAAEFAATFLQRDDARAEVQDMEKEDAQDLLRVLLQSQQSAVSEYELVCLLLRVARKHRFSLEETHELIHHIDVSALSTAEKYSLTSALEVGAGRADVPFIWNSLLRSDILTPTDLYQRMLDRPFSIHRLYSSKIHGLTTFFSYLKLATQGYSRKLLIMKVDNRFAVGVFMRGLIPWDEDPEVNDNVVVCSFMPKTASTIATLRPCTKGYRFYCGDANLQLYNKQRGDTFIFVTKPPAASGAEVAVSIALGKISQTVQTQLGRINRTPVTAIELHVISNRDRVSHQLFDLWFEHVPTEELVKRLDRKAVRYHHNSIEDVNWDEYPDWVKSGFVQYTTINRRSDVVAKISSLSPEIFEAYLDTKTLVQIEVIMNVALTYHAEKELFSAYNHVIAREPFPREFAVTWMNNYPSLAFALLKAFPPGDDLTLPPPTSALSRLIIQNLIRSANEMGIAALVALEKIANTIATLPLGDYLDLLMLSAMSIRAPQVVQEVLLVLNDCRLGAPDIPHHLKYGYKQALGVVFDRAEEAADECPCGEDGRPAKRMRVAPTRVQKLSLIQGHPNRVKADIRVDEKSNVRLHSHVRLQATSKAENKFLAAPVVDGVVVQAQKGEIKIDLQQPPPPELELMDWKLYNAGSIANTKAMLDAIRGLLERKTECCRFYAIITGDPTIDPLAFEPPESSRPEAGNRLNESQQNAVYLSKAPLSLIWGPPGTGKTTVVVQVLRSILQQPPNGSDEVKILMTASTHNAVDNVLERFLHINKALRLLREDQILRVATDQSKVNKDLQHFTIDARVGGDLNENNRLMKQAMDRVNAATIIFTTCAGAGLGIMRKVDFTVAIIDEASQVTEPCALIPLVKGVERAILVGDHVQLRPTVKNFAKAIEFDVSLLERLYTTAEAPGMVKTMLDVQYRSPRALNAFPSKEFYNNNLKTGVENNDHTLTVLKTVPFPWPTRDGVLIPVVFIPCSTEEDMGGMSKSNTGQVEVVEHILPLLSAPQSVTRGAAVAQAVATTSSTSDQDSTTTPASSVVPLSITILTPYTKQVQVLRQKVPSTVSVSTIDAFQGRESDIVIFSSVRCNVEGDIGFLEDSRRLNVMWTRARLALIVIGDRRTMSSSPLWARALQACEEVEMKVAHAL